MWRDVREQQREMHIRVLAFDFYGRDGLCELANSFVNQAKELLDCTSLTMLLM